MFDDIISDNPEEIVHRSMDRLRGRLCGLIESWGMDDKRERGAIQTLKTLTYDSEKILVELVNSMDDDERDQQ